MANDDRWVLDEQGRVKQGQRVPREHTGLQEDFGIEKRGQRVGREEPRPAPSQQGSTTGTPTKRPTRAGGRE